MKSHSNALIHNHKVQNKAKLQSDNFYNRFSFEYELCEYDALECGIVFGVLLSRMCRLKVKINDLVHKMSFITV